MGRLIFVSNALVKCQAYVEMNAPTGNDQRKTNALLVAGKVSNCLLLLTCMTIISGCERPKTQHDPPVIEGERTNAQGQIEAQIVRDNWYTTKTAWLTADGPRKSVIKYEVKYSLRKQGMATIELPMLNHGECAFCARFWPVAKSKLWVGAGINPLSNVNTGHVAVVEGKRLVSHNEYDLHLVVFDEKRLIAHRVVSVIPKWESGEEEFRYDAVNGDVIFKAPDGLTKYNALADRLTKMTDRKQ